MVQPKLAAYARTRVTRVVGVLALSLVLLLPAQATPAATSAGVGFEDASIAPFNIGPAAPGGVSFPLDSSAPEGSHVMRSQVKLGVCWSGDKDSSGGCKRYHEQIVLPAATHKFQTGDEVWFGRWMNFVGPFNTAGGFTSLGGWHNPTICGSSATQASALQLKSATQLELKASGGPNCADSLTGSARIQSASATIPAPVSGWHRVVEHRVLSGSDAQGVNELYIDGQKLISFGHANLNTASASTSYVYLKVGLYVGASGAKDGETLLYDDLRLGGSYEEVAAGSAPPTDFPPPPPPPGPSPPPPPAPNFTVATSGLAEGQTVSGAVRWEAVPAGGTVDRVEFLIDGQRRWMDRGNPYVFSGDTGNWDTTTVANGDHTLKARAYATDGRIAVSTKHVTVANSVHPPDPGPPPVTTFQETTVGVAEGDTLSGAVRWEAVPTGATIDRVEFLIDGANRWTERGRPYVFNGNTGTWDTTLEAEGDHTLLARAIATDGRETTSTVHVYVVKSRISFAQVPVVSRWRRVDVRATAPAGSAVIATISGPLGGTLGRAHAVTRPDGHVGLRVRLPRWLGQRPLYVAIVSQLDGTLDRATNVVALPELAYVRRPRIGGRGRLVVRATGLTGSRVKIIVRGLNGRVLGVAHATAGRSGAIRRRVVFSRWSGERRLRVVMKMPVFENGVLRLRRSTIVIRLSAREVRRARSG